MILRGNYNSEILHMSTHLQVMFPDKFISANTANRPLRIIYLLHGLHGDSSTWLHYTPLPYYAKKLNTVFVMPEVGRSFYSDLMYGRKYYTYVSQELPIVCRKLFNFSARREDTAIMGCSMGGFGSLYIALKNPELFGFCGPIAPACMCMKDLLAELQQDPKPMINSSEEAREIFIDIKALYGEKLEYDPEYDIYEKIKTFPANLPKPKIFATCGLEDDLRKESLLMKNAIQNCGFDFTYHAERRL